MSTRERLRRFLREAEAETSWGWRREIAARLVRGDAAPDPIVLCARAEVRVVRVDHPALPRYGCSRDAVLYAPHADSAVERMRIATGLALYLLSSSPASWNEADVFLLAFELCCPSERISTVIAPMLPAITEEWSAHVSGKLREFA